MLVVQGGGAVPRGAKCSGDGKDIPFRVAEDHLVEVEAGPPRDADIAAGQGQVVRPLPGTDVIPLEEVADVHIAQVIFAKVLPVVAHGHEELPVVLVDAADIEHAEIAALFP